jgi:antitoxin component YwqK of YwqJK toxin-antitoxin module
MRTPIQTTIVTFAALTVSFLLMAAPQSVSTIIEYFDKAETRPEYERSFYMKDGEEMLHGIETFWFQNGGIEGKSNYKDGIQHGESSWHYRNGDVRWSCIFDKGRLIEGKYFNHGGKLACEIKDGKGQCKEYDEATGTKLLYIADYTDGVKNGKEINYDENGKIFSSKVWKRGILKSEK